MSRGAGETQSLLIDIIRREGPNLPLPSLLWAAAAEEGVLAGKDLPDESYKRLHAAAKRLLKPSARGIVSVCSESAATIDELIKWYPDRTKDGTVRELRRELLPLVASYATSHSRGVRSLAESEEYTLSRASKQLRARLVAAWKDVETFLIAELPRLRRTSRRPALELLARGHSLTVADSVISSRASLLETIAQMSEVARVRSRLGLALRRLARLLPVRKIERARLRTIVASAARIGKYEQQGLKETFQRHLLRSRPGILRALPGHQEFDVQSLWLLERGVEFDPKLDQLLLRDALRDFQLYSLNSRS